MYSISHFTVHSSEVNPCKQKGPSVWPVPLRPITSQFKDIVSHTQKLKSVKCIFCNICVHNFVCNFNGALLKFHTTFWTRTQKKYTFYEVLRFEESWYLKERYDILGLSETGPWCLACLRHPSTSRHGVKYISFTWWSPKRVNSNTHVISLSSDCTMQLHISAHA